MLFTTVIIAALSMSPSDCAPPREWAPSASPSITQDKKCKCSCDCDKCSAPEKPYIKEISPEPFVMHRMVDRFGQTWEHSDKTYLQQYINSRNVIPQYYYGAGSSCSTGTCPRR